MTAETETRITVAEERRQKSEQLAADLEARTDALMDVLGSRMSVDRFKRVVVLAVSKNPELQDCTRESLLRAILEAAQDGLEPTGPAGGAHLVPFRNSSGVLEAVLIRDYRGLFKMALRGDVRQIEVNIVHEGDHLDLVMGSEPHVRFIPVRDGSMRGNYQGVYTVLHFKDPATPQAITYQTIEDINKVRNSTRGGGKRGPWADWYDEMVIKTAVRHALKLRATTPEMYDALAREDAVETAWDEPANRHPSVERRERLVAAIAPERARATETAAQAQEAEPDVIEENPAPAAVVAAERDPETCASRSPIDGAVCSEEDPDHKGVHRQIVDDEVVQTWPKK
jgi:recombination protein RecT